MTRSGRGMAALAAVAIAAWLPALAAPERDDPTPAGLRQTATETAEPRAAAGQAPANPAAAKRASLQAAVDARRRDVVLSEGGKRQALRVARIAPLEGPIEGVRVLADSGPGATRYLLLELDSASRENGGAGFCGAGVETDLVWLALDAAWAVRKHDAYRIASCLEPLEPGTRDDGADGSVRVTLLRYGRDGAPDREVSVRYDGAEPEQGLQVHDRVR